VIDFVPPVNVGVAATTEPPAEARVRLWPNEALLVNAIVTFPAFACSEFELNISIPLAGALSDRADELDAGAGVEVEVAFVAVEAGVEAAGALDVLGADFELLLFEEPHAATPTVIAAVPSRSASLDIRLPFGEELTLWSGAPGAFYQPGRRRGMILPAGLRDYAAAGGMAGHQLDPERLGDHIDRLYRAAWGLCGSREEAEDLVQETYARVLRKPRFLTSEDDLGYLLRVLRNTFISSRRRAMRRPSTAALPDELDLVEDPRAVRAESRIEAAELYTAISELPEQFRDALVAIDLVGLSYREAAIALKTPEATITTRLHRARQRVAKALTASEQNAP
jgi:RNA polymerase sigma-70 factor (ECF subfamily)